MFVRLYEYTWKVHTLAADACTVYEISPGCAVVATEASAIASIVGDARPSLLNSGLDRPAAVADDRRDFVDAAAGAVGGVVAPANRRRRSEQRSAHRSRRARATPRATGAAATKMRAAATAACSSSSSGPASLSRGHRRHIPRRSRSRVFAGTSQRRHRSPRATMGARTAEPRAAAATAVAAASSAGRNHHSPSRSRRNRHKPHRDHRRHRSRRSRSRVVAGTSQCRRRSPRAGMAAEAPHVARRAAAAATASRRDQTQADRAAARRSCSPPCNRRGS